MTALLLVAAALALLPALNTLINVALLRTPPLPAGTPGVAILIPARDEEATIGACVDAALASQGVDVEVIVLDDGSRDQTRAIVEERCRRDVRLRMASAPPLPEGWKGKPHACQVLSQLASRPFLLFVDADVRLSPDAAARLVPPAGVDLVSGVPRQIVGGAVEAAVIPMIDSLIYGYLPVALMRAMPWQALTAACGQLIMVRAAAYRQCGGHGAVAGYMHDGMQLAKLFRRHGCRTDLVHGAGLAQCRMYDSAKAVFEGFAKNATEGMARPLALPVWTLAPGRRPSATYSCYPVRFRVRCRRQPGMRGRAVVGRAAARRARAASRQMPRALAGRRASSARRAPDIGDPVAGAVRLSEGPAGAMARPYLRSDLLKKASAGRPGLNPTAP